MIDLHDVTVITTATIDSPDRLRNTALFLRYFETFCTNYEIIVAESDRESKLEELTSGKAGVFLRFMETENCHCRAKNLNSGAILSERKFLLICDLDVFIPPSSLEKALAMVRNGVDFVLPFNGVAVQIKRNAIDKDMDLHALMDSLVYFSRFHQIRPPQFDPEIFEHMLGTMLGDTVGGIMICNRRKFFLSGAMNENMLSMGCEEVEFYHRIRKLGYRVERIEDGNAYHFEHTRSANSVFNNYHATNEAELERVKAMEPDELRRYANSGFKNIKLDTTYDVTVTNTPSEYTIKVMRSDRIELPNTCIVLVFENSQKEDAREVDKFFDHMEAYFDNYFILVIEGEYARFRLCLARKYVRHIRHIMPLVELSDDEIMRKLVYTDRSTIEVYRFEDRFDPSKVTGKYDPAKFQTVGR